MKKYLLGLFAVVLAIGFSAFTPGIHKAKASLTTYYAIKTSSTHWRWSTTIPEGFSCLGETGAPTCSVQAASQPADDSAPGGTSNVFYRE